MARHAQSHVQGGRRHAIGRVGGKDDALGGHAREELDHVQREEAGDVVQNARVLSKAGRDDSLVADRPVRQDQHGPRMAQGEVDEPRCKRRQPASGVNQNGYAGAFGEREDLVHVLAVEHETLGPGVQLYPASPGGQTPFALRQWAFGGIETAEGREPSVAFARPTRARDRLAGDRQDGARVVEGENACPARFGLVEL